MERPVVVGTDGSPRSLVAAEQAAAAATLRGRPLHLVHGYLHPFGYGVPIDPYNVGVPEPSEEARKMLEQAATDLRQRWPDLTIEVRQVAGGPAATLIEESKRAELLVVGNRGRGGFAGLLLGSVSTQVAGHAHCPVLVIRPTDEPVPSGGPVVVGVDGSDGSRLAVEYAADEATRRGVDLVLIHAWAMEWAPPLIGAAPGTAWPPQRYEEIETAYREEAVQLLATTAARVRQRHPELRIEERPLRSVTAEQALIDASKEASLLVVGSRGRGGFAGLLLGSVSQAAVHHARCPVLVAHRTGQPADPVTPDAPPGPGRRVDGVGGRVAGRD